MKKVTIFFVFFLSVFLFSCISNKKITYLQFEDEYRDLAITGKDTMVRTYQPVDFDYRFKTNDLLDIKISTATPSIYNPFNDADRTLVPGQMLNNYSTGQNIKTQGYYINSAGYLELPIIGNILIAGLTIKQAEDTISINVAKYLEDPVVRIKMLNFRFSVIGEVTKEGTLLSDDNYLTLIQALSLAGGVTEYGDLSRVKLIRHNKEEVTVFYINLLNEEFFTSSLYFVQPGDVIVVSPLRQKAYLKYVSPNLNIFATSFSLLVAILALFR